MSKYTIDDIDIFLEKLDKSDKRDFLKIFSKADTKLQHRLMDSILEKFDNSDIIHLFCGTINSLQLIH